MAVSNVRNGVSVPVAGTAGSVKSIAGRAHGAKPSVDPNLSKSPKKWYPEVSGLVHPTVENALRVMCDNIYQLRDQQHAGQKDAAGASAAAAGGGGAAGSGAGASKSSVPDSAMATGIHGIRIQAATDPTSLKTGDTIRYNSATSQFEFGS